MGKAREMFNLFNVFNALSWNMLVGSIVTLLAMRLGASSTYIGTLSALLYVSLFFLPLGRLLARRARIISIFSLAWIFRALGMLPVALAPLAAHMGSEDAALGMTMLGVAVFHVARGVGMVGNTPVLSSLASGPDRGSYMTQVQIISSAAGMLSGLAIAIALGSEPPLFLYSIIMAAGIACGITSGLIMRKVPEPAAEPQAEAPRLPAIFREAFSQPGIRLFLAIFMIVALVSGVSRTFLVVYAREVFFKDDGTVLLYTVLGGLGHLLVGMLVKFLVDRIGAKPLFMVCVLIGLATMVPILVFPRSAIGSAAAASLFLAFLFFMLNFGFLGSEGIAQTYFLGLAPPAKMLDMGIVYFFALGAAGAGGAFLAGILLDALMLAGFSPLASFRALFAALAALAALALFMQRRLTPLGALPLPDAVRVMFSYRDLHAISLLDRLDRSGDFQEQEQLLDALHRSPSQLSTKRLLEQAKSPRLATRMEAIRALERLDSLSEAAEKALVNDIVSSPFTTAYISARILGNHGYAPAIPILRELASSEDYMLAGEAMIALARLGDCAFRPQLEKIIAATENPRLKIMGVESLGIYRSPDSLGALIGILKGAAPRGAAPHGAEPPPHLRDEAALAMSEIAGVQSQFSRSLVRFLAEPALAPALALDAAETAAEFCAARLGGARAGMRESQALQLARRAQSLPPAVSALAVGGDPEPLSRWMQGLPAQPFAGSPSFKAAQAVFSQALLDPEAAPQRRLQLLASHWAAHQLRSWAERLK